MTNRDDRLTAEAAAPRGDITAEVIEAARRIVKVFDRTCGNGAMHDAIWGRPLLYGVDGYEGGLAIALRRHDAAAAGKPVPPPIQRPREWDVYDEWRRAGHSVKKHPRDAVCVAVSPPWGPMGAGALCHRPVHRTGRQWRHLEAEPAR